jgi:hypothetical protein
MIFSCHFCNQHVLFHQRWLVSYTSLKETVNLLCCVIFMLVTRIWRELVETDSQNTVPCQGLKFSLNPCTVFPPSHHQHIHYPTLMVRIILGNEYTLMTLLSQSKKCQSCLNDNKLCANIQSLDHIWELWTFFGFWMKNIYRNWTHICELSEFPEIFQKSWKIYFKDYMWTADWNFPMFNFLWWSSLNLISPHHLSNI